MRTRACRCVEFCADERTNEGAKTNERGSDDRRVNGKKEAETSRDGYSCTFFHRISYFVSSNHWQTTDLYVFIYRKLQKSTESAFNERTTIYKISKVRCLLQRFQSIRKILRLDFIK